MQILKTKKALSEALSAYRKDAKKTAFVPTMGALHRGHLHLIHEAKAIADIVVCSIFVNPTQFNDPKDLEKYPRPIENDIALLEEEHCDFLFLPDTTEIYPSNEEKWHIDLNGLDTIWEGEHRPGHFQGVTQVVYKLFQIVNPTVALFGQKDFQQVMVIQRMVDTKQLPVQLHIVETVRDPKGLALSSRNMRLSEDGLVESFHISKALYEIQDNYKTTPFETLEDAARKKIEASGNIKVEYLAICVQQDLRQAKSYDPSQSYVVLVAAWLEGVRLIDNMLLS